jgi:hypothetical protein
MPAAAGAVAGWVTTATGGAIAGTAASVIGGAVVGAATGAIVAAVTGGDILKGALIGGITGGIMHGLSEVAGAAESTVQAGTTVAETVPENTFSLAGTDGAFGEVAETATTEGLKTAAAEGAKQASSGGILSSLAGNQSFMSGLANAGAAVLDDSGDTEEKVSHYESYGGFDSAKRSYDQADPGDVVAQNVASEDTSKAGTRIEYNWNAGFQNTMDELKSIFDKTQTSSDIAGKVKFKAPEINIA